MTEIDDVQQEMAAARAELLAALVGTTAEELERRPPGEISDDERRWPIVDVLWHVGVIEDRFRRTIDQALDGRELTTDAPRTRPAHMTTLPLLLEWLDQSRRPTEVLLQRMNSADLAIEIPRPDGSTRTPARFLAIIAGHDRQHAQQVRDLRALVDA